MFFRSDISRCISSRSDTVSSAGVIGSELLAASPVIAAVRVVTSAPADQPTPAPPSRCNRTSTANISDNAPLKTKPKNFTIIDLLKIGTRNKFTVEENLPFQTELVDLCFRDDQIAVYSNSYTRTIDDFHQL